MLNSLYQPLADATQMPIDHLKVSKVDPQPLSVPPNLLTLSLSLLSQLFSLLLLSFPLSFPLPSLSPTQKHLTSILVSTFFLVGVLELYHGYFQLILACAWTYAACLFKLGGKKMPWIVFWGQMAHLTGK